ncbi:efflux RND transporter periplasmic adaptor subunit [bacterium]|nr:efflux RND transporter periplasmic adaptor subunit [bacterium]
MSRITSSARRVLNNPALALAATIFLVAHIAAQPGRGPAPVTTTRVESGAFAQPIRLTGNVEPIRAATIGSEIGGILDELLVDEGDRVTEGQSLARHRLAPLEFAVQEAEADAQADAQALAELEAGTRAEDLAIARAQYEEAKVRAEMAERDYTRSKQLFADGTISEGEYDVARENWESRRAQRDLEKASLDRAEAGPRSQELAKARAEAASTKAAADLARDRLDRATIRAPFAGVITKKYTDVGAWLSSGEALFDLEADDTVRVVVDVPETHFHNVTMGMPVEIVFDAYPSETFEGKVTARVPKASPRSRAFPVKIDVSNPQHRLAAGMLARLEFQPPAPGEQSVIVHKDAIVPMAPNPIVYKVGYNEQGDPIAEAVSVTTGRYFGEAVEVFGDLKDGDQVVIRGNERLQPGQLLLLNTFVSESRALDTLQNEARKATRE